MKTNSFIALLITLCSSLHVAEAQNSSKAGRWVGPDYSMMANKHAVQNILLPSGIQLEYVEQGNPAGVAVILLHGYTDSWHSFETVLSCLPGDLHVFALSQRGHGNSARPASGYHPTDFARDVADFIQVKKLGQAYIVGHSMGGLIAQQFTLTYPQLVRGMVLSATDAFFADNAGIPEFSNEIMQMNEPIPYAFAEEFQKSTCHKPIDTAYFRLLVNEGMKVPVRVMKAAMKGIMEVDFREQLQLVKVPVLIVWADKDNFCPRSSQDDFLKRLPNARLLVYESTGHALHWEEPLRFANDLNEFITSKNK